MSKGLLAKRTTRTDRLARELRRSTFLRIVVPSRTATCRLLLLSHWTEVVLELVLPHSGGATEIDARGHWLDWQQRSVTEDVRLLDIYLRKQLAPQACHHLVRQFGLLAARMGQEVLAVAVGHRLHLVRPARLLAGYRDTQSRRCFLTLAATANGRKNGRPRFTNS